MQSHQNNPGRNFFKLLTTSPPLSVLKEAVAKFPEWIHARGEFNIDPVRFSMNCCAPELTFFLLNQPGVNLTSVNMTGSLFSYSPTNARVMKYLIQNNFADRAENQIEDIHLLAMQSDKHQELLRAMRGGSELIKRKNLRWRNANLLGGLSCAGRNHPRDG